MSGLKELKQLTPLDAANVAGGEADCTVTANIGTGGIGVTATGTDTQTMVATTLIGTYEGIIQATSYAIERVINAVSTN